MVGPDHHRHRTVHRDGDRLERPRRRGLRVRSRPRGDQLGDADPLLRAVCVVLRDDSAAALRRPRCGRQHLAERDRDDRAHLPGHPVRSRHHHALLAHRAQGQGLVRDRVRAEDRARDPRRAALHDLRHVLAQGRPDRPDSARRHHGRTADARVLRDHVLCDVLRRQGDRPALRQDHHARLHRGLEQLRTRHRRVRRRLRHQQRPSVRRRHRPARGSPGAHRPGQRRPGLPREVLRRRARPHRRRAARSRRGDRGRVHRERHDCGPTSPRDEAIRTLQRHPRQHGRARRGAGRHRCPPA